MLRGHGETIGERLVRDLEAFRCLPPAPYDACEKKAGRVSSQLLVRYRGTDYSVPTAYAHREVLTACHRLILHRHCCALANLSIDLRVLVHYKVHLVFVLAGNFQTEGVSTITNSGHLPGNGFGRLLFLLVCRVLRICGAQSHSCAQC